MNSHIYTRNLLVSTQNTPLFRRQAELFLNSKETNPADMIKCFSLYFFGLVPSFEGKAQSLYTLNQSRLIKLYFESKSPEKLAKIITKLMQGQLEPKVKEYKNMSDQPIVNSNQARNEFYDQLDQLIKKHNFDVVQIKDSLSQFYSLNKLSQDHIFNLLTVCLENSSDVNLITAYITKLLESKTHIETFVMRLKNELEQFGNKELISYFGFIGSTLEQITPTYNKWCDALLEATSCNFGAEPIFRPKLTKELAHAFLSAGGR